MFKLIVNSEYLEHAQIQQVDIIILISKNQVLQILGIL